MTFVWPEMLWLMAVLPLLLAAYVWVLRRKKKLAVRYASLSMVREAMGAGSRIKRHLPPLLFLLPRRDDPRRGAAAGNDHAAHQHETVILAMDISGSMRATDVEPNRLVAAQNAAKQFVAEQPETCASASLPSPAPRRSRRRPRATARMIAAIDRFQLQRATAIGSAIIVSLATIFPEAGIDVGTLTYGSTPARRARSRPAPRRPSRCRRARMPRR